MSLTRATNTSIRYRVAAGIIAGLGMITISAMPGAADTAKEEDVWQNVDGGSLGVSADAGPDIWCLVDAGSLGVPDPVAACG